MYDFFSRFRFSAGSLYLVLVKFGDSRASTLLHGPLPLLFHPTFPFSFPLFFFRWRSCIIRRKNDLGGETVGARRRLPFLALVFFLSTCSPLRHDLAYARGIFCVAQRAV